MPHELKVIRLVKSKMVKNSLEIFMFFLINVSKLRQYISIWLCESYLNIAVKHGLFGKLLHFYHISQESAPESSKNSINDQLFAKKAMFNNNY